MARIAKTIDVDVPVRTAYNQWTQFEDFPQFMEGVQEVRQVDDNHLHWRAKVAGKEKEWNAEIREQVPDEKLIWVATDGPENAGMVTFDRLDDSRTRVHLEMSYDPEGFLENAGDALGMVSRRVTGDLERFKDFIEGRQAETGGWRGEIHNPDVPGGHTRGVGSLDERGGQQADLESKDPRAEQRGDHGEFVDTSSQQRTPGAMEPGSLSREAHQREQAGYSGRNAGPGMAPSETAERDD